MNYHFALDLSSAPGAEPILIADARMHLRVTATGSPATHPDDTLINRMIKAARRKTERDTSRGLITQTWVQYMDGFPGEILLARAPVSSVTSVKYVDVDGDEQTIDTADYRTDLISEPARINPVYGEVWPSSRDVTNAVYVTFVAGYGAAGSDVDEDLLSAVYLLLGHYYEHREAAQDVTKVEAVPMGYYNLIADYILRA